MVYHLKKSCHQSPPGYIILKKAVSYLHYGVSSYKKLSSISNMVYHLKKAIINLHQSVSSYKRLSSISNMVYHLIKSHHQSPTWCINLQKAISNLHQCVSSYKTRSEL